MDTEDVFEKRGQMVAEVQRGMGQVLLSHGFQVEDCLVTVSSHNQLHPVKIWQ
jgi:hypothetical protein